MHTHALGQDGLCVFVCTVSGCILVCNCEYNPSSYFLCDFYVLFATVILKGTIAKLTGLSKLTGNFSLGV